MSIDEANEQERAEISRLSLEHGSPAGAALVLLRRLEEAGIRAHKAADELEALKHDIEQALKGRDAEANARIAAESRLDRYESRIRGLFVALRQSEGMTMAEGYDAWEKHGKRNLLVDEHPMDRVVETAVHKPVWPVDANGAPIETGFDDVMAPQREAWLNRKRSE